MFEFYNIFENETRFDFSSLLKKQEKAYKIWRPEPCGSSGSHRKHYQEAE